MNCVKLAPMIMTNAIKDQCVTSTFVAADMECKQMALTAKNTVRFSAYRVTQLDKTQAISARIATMVTIGTTNLVLSRTICL